MTAIWKRPIAHLSEPFGHRRPDTHVLTLCRLGRLNEALQALRSTPTPPHPSACSSVLQLCIDLKAWSVGKSLHEHLSETSFSPDLHLNTKLIIFYAKSGDTSAARRVFDGMLERNIVSWTAMISGYSQNGYPLDALRTFFLMHRSNFKANQFTYGSVLRACTRICCVRSGMQIQACAVKSRFVKDLHVESALVDLHLKCGSVEDARCLFKMMERRDVVSWNSVIGGHAVRGLGEDAFSLFRHMLRDGLRPDHFTFGNVLKACGVVMSLACVDQVHGSIFQIGYGTHSIVGGSLIDAYVKCRSMKNARLLYESMPVQDLISCTTLITGYSQDGQCSGEAMGLFCQINKKGVRVDNVILCSMLNICANGAFLILGRQIHAHISKIEPNNDVALSNALIDMYAKCGELQDAYCAFDEMQDKNVISWTSLICGYGKHGYGNTAIKLFGMMEDDGVKPNDVTFLSLLSACSHSGLTTKGIDYFNFMASKYGIHPRAEHYSCAVDLLARSGQLEEAYDFMCKMNLKTNSSLWGTILGACRMHGNTSLGEVAAGHLFHLHPQDPANYIVLANIYAEAGQWENALKTRRLMEERYARKDAGYSFSS